MPIGSGFDLAHGPRTNYGDFVDYLRSSAEGRDLLENMSWFNGFMDKALHNIDQSYWCDFEDGFSYMDIDESKMRNSIYGNTQGNRR